MSLHLVALALLMGAVTYPSRALPILAPGIERLPPRALDYLRLVGPGVLAALAAVSVLVVREGRAAPTVHFGIEFAAILAGIAVVRRWHNVSVGIIVAVVLVALVRAIAPA